MESPRGSIRSATPSEIERSGESTLVSDEFHDVAFVALQLQLLEATVIIVSYLGVRDRDSDCCE
jgi:hypothetical protein